MSGFKGLFNFDILFSRPREVIKPVGHGIKA